MGSVNRILAVAETTFRETIRNKVLLHLVGFAAVLLALGWVVSNWSLGEPGKIVADIGLSITSLAGVAIALFSGIVLVWGEVERRTILTVLAKPLSRQEFVAGKFLGFGFAVTLVYTGMNLLLALLLTSVGTPVTSGIVAAAYLSWWEVILIVALALLFSSFSTPTLSALYTIMLFVAGRFSGDIRVFIADNPLSHSRPLLEAIYMVIPHFGSFNIRLEAVHGLPITASKVLIPSLYGLFYCLAILTAATLIFRRRDLA